MNVVKGNVKDWEWVGFIFWGKVLIVEVSVREGIMGEEVGMVFVCWVLEFGCVSGGRLYFVLEL